MYKINRQDNKIEKLPRCSFKKLGFKEKEHLQEWIAKEPACFGEELLIIQKEFSGFDGTNERLDLLALDKKGALVIIENKLDDSGKDVTGQALKYASYCSNFSKEYIRDIYQEYLNKHNPEDKAEEKLSQFFNKKDYEDLELNEGITQRIILVAANFSMEVKSTVLWLLNFNVHLQCFRVTPYSEGEHCSKGDELFLNFEKIIPPQDVEEWMIGMKKKEQANMEAKKKGQDIRKEFWTELLERMNDQYQSNLFQNISPSVDSWINKTSGIGGASFHFSVSRTYGRACLYIDKGGSDSNKKETQFIYNKLLKYKEQIESNFGRAMRWDSMEGKQACRIKVETPGNVYDKEQWNAMITFMIENMLKLAEVMKEPLNEIKQKLKESPRELDLENEEENG